MHRTMILHRELLRCLPKLPNQRAGSRALDLDRCERARCYIFAVYPVGGTDRLVGIVSVLRCTFPLLRFFILRKPIHQLDPRATHARRDACTHLTCTRQCTHTHTWTATEPFRLLSRTLRFVSPLLDEKPFWFAVAFFFHPAHTVGVGAVFRPFFCVFMNIGLTTMDIFLTKPVSCMLGCFSPPPGGTTLLTGSVYFIDIFIPMVIPVYIRSSLMSNRPSASFVCVLL